MHIPDGILSPYILGATGVIAAGGVVAGLRKLDVENLPRVGVLSAVFFVTSLIHVPIPPASAHLMLSGLLGCMLGWAAIPAIACGLLLQAVLFGHGGITSLGANVVIQTVPAVICFGLFGRHIRRGMKPKKVSRLAFAAGATAVALSCFLLCGILLAGGKEFTVIAKMTLIGNIPIAIIEGFVTASAMVFISKVKPELLAAPRELMKS